MLIPVAVPCDRLSAYSIHSEVFDNAPCPHGSKKPNLLCRALDIKIIDAKISSVECAAEVAKRQPSCRGIVGYACGCCRTDCALVGQGNIILQEIARG